MLPRDWNVVSTFGRKAGPMKDRRAARGGARNSQQEMLAEYEEDSREETCNGTQERSREASTD